MADHAENADTPAIGRLPAEALFDLALARVKHQLTTDQYVELANRCNDVGCDRADDAARAIGRFLCDTGHEALWFRAYQVYRSQCIVYDEPSQVTPEDARAFLEREEQP